MNRPLLPLLCFFFTVFFLATFKQTQAYTFTVSSLNDSGAGTLRQALSYVNNGDSIVFSVSGTINITTELSCTKAIHIIGPGSGSLTVNAGDNSRVFNLNTVGALHIEGLTIKDGNVTPGNGLQGGGIYATVEELYLTDVVINSNVIGTTSSSGQANVKGGGAYIESDLLVLTDVVVSGNSSNGRPTAFGGGLYIVSDVVLMYNTNISSNMVNTDQYVGGSTATAGGAYIDADSIYFDHCNINNNSATAESGWQTYDSGNTKGGGIYTTNSSPSANALVMQNVNIYSNYSNAVGNYSYPYAGGWYGEDHAIVADSVKMYLNRIYMYDWHDGTGRGYGMYLSGVSSFDMTNSEIYNHEYNKNGYDHHVVYISASGTINFNYLKAYDNDIQANYSEDIFYLAGSNGLIKNAEFYDNNAFSSSTMRLLIANFTGALNIEQCSFYNNDLNITVNAGDLNLINSTMTDNTEEIYTTNSSSTIALVNSTVDGTITAPDMEFENTILFVPTLSGTITTNGGNIINSPSYSSSFTMSSDKNNVNPVLDTFDYHGGYTKVYSLLPFSQAINAGVSNGITTDQRGYTRVGNVDIGAYEYNGINPNVCTPVNVTDVVNACGSYTWIDGNTYTSNNSTAKDTLTGSGGCDSIITLNLTIHQPVTSTDYVVACGTYTWVDGNTYTANNNTATHTLQNQMGCDSTITLNLTINNSVHQTHIVTSCGSYTWVDGNTYNSSNTTATHTIPGSNGCDSVLHLNLTVLNASSGTAVVTACNSYTWINGITYTSSNSTATHTLTASNGCDSVVTLNLTILNSSSSVDVVEACETYTWIDGNTYTSSNSTATHVVTNAQGCDSVITLNLTIKNSIHQTQFITACESHTWINGTTYTSSNSTATHTLTRTNGCDSVLHLNLTILDAAAGTDIVSACDNYTWINGTTYTSSNSTATHTLTASNGCDSVVTLNLTILNSSASTDVVEACDSYTWMDGNTYTSSNSTATYVMTNALGCDSIITLNLTMKNSIHQTQFITACDSYDWIDGNTYTTSNSTATHTMTRTNGCDSVLHLNLTILNATSGTAFVSKCDSYTWIDGNTYTESTSIPTVTLLNSAGCDSVVTLNLTILKSTSITDIIEACESHTWIDGKTYTSSNNTATHTIFNAAGCDSIIYLNLTIFETESTLYDTVITEGDTVFVGTSQYTEEGVYTDQFISAHGCDSTVTTVIYTKPNGVAKLGEESMKIYPNPMNGSFIVEGAWQDNGGLIRVLNSLGQPIHQVQCDSRNVRQQISLSNQPSGIYFVELSGAEGTSVHRVIKVR